MIAAAIIGTAATAALVFLMTEQGREVTEAPPAPTAEYGRRLFAETTWYLGPDHPDQSRRYSGSRLNCSSCHLQAGRQPGMLSMTETYSKYPRPLGQGGGAVDLEDQIDWCMERSMNGRALPRAGVEMAAMVAYIKSVGEEWLARSPRQRVIVQPSSLRPPMRPASVEAGEKVFEARCHVCHGNEGAGKRVSGDPRRGYVFPPLWGGDSFNNGAGMAQVLTAARFIKARMPFGNPDLTDDEAFDVAAYINSQPRPQFSIAPAGAR